MWDWQSWALGDWPHSQWICAFPVYRLHLALGWELGLLSSSLLRFCLPVFHLKQHDTKSHNLVIIAIHSTATWHLKVTAVGYSWSLCSARTKPQSWHWLGVLGSLCTGQSIKQIFCTDLNWYLHGFLCLWLGQFIFQNILNCIITCLHCSSFEDIAISVSSYLMND